MSNVPADRLVWIDCEMTGLDVERDGLCEIAVIITDFALEPLHPGLDLVINPGEAALAQMNDFVRGMHTDSGLLPRIASGLSVAEAEQRVIDYLTRFIPTGKHPLVAGNTIGMDRRFIARYMPALEERLHYRSVDVSTLKELARQWYPAAFFGAPAKRGGHRALADIAESIQELAYFRDAVLVPGAGPDKPGAEALAAAARDRYASLVEGVGAETDGAAGESAGASAASS